MVVNLADVNLVESFYHVFEGHPEDSIVPWVMVKGLSQLFGPLIVMVAESSCPLALFPWVSHLDKVHLLTVFVGDGSSSEE